jgi:6-phosphofructokinase 1
MKEAVAILCGGGPAPGINTVISSVSKSFLRSGYKVLGVHEAYKGLFSENPELTDINYEFADRIYHRGGSAIKMSRHKPKNSEFSVDFFVKNNVKLLVTIGGDDTASTANRITKFLNEHDVDIKNIHVPKTIDNDLPLPDGVPTFGFNSAIHTGVDISKTIKVESLTTQNWYIVSTMGREAGHLAFEIGKSIHSSMIVIPEMFNKTEITIKKIVDLIVSAMIKRRLLGVKPGVAVISEGVFHYLSEEDICSSGITFSYDDHGHPELGNISKAHIFNTLVANRIKELGLDIKNRPVEIGYSLRCCPPVAYDLAYCTSLGMGVKKLYDEGFTGCMVALDTNKKIIPIYLKDVEDEKGKIRPRLVDVSSEEVSEVLLNNVYYITEDDYEAAKALIPNPEDYDYFKILNWENVPETV